MKYIKIKTVKLAENVKSIKKLKIIKKS